MGKSNVKVTPPTVDPAKIYPSVPGIDYTLFELSEEGLPEKQRQQALAQLFDYLSAQRAHFLGYQANQKLEYSSELSQYLDFHINNIGDPFVSGNFTVNSKFAERAVLDYFASLWNAQWPNQEKAYQPGDVSWSNSYWGYVVSMGCTEGNVYGLWNARDYLAGRFILLDPASQEKARQASINGKPVGAEPRYIYYKAKATDANPNAYTPVAFYSQDTHYSIIKAMRILEISTFNEIGSGIYPCPLDYPQDYPNGFSAEYLDENGWPFEVPSDNNGSIYIPALLKLVAFFAEKGYPILVNFNYGTTFKGAFDYVHDAIEQLIPILKKYGLYERNVYYDPDHPEKFDVRNGFWFHVDGALGAAYMPFLEMAMQDGKYPITGYRFPQFDFRDDNVHSISVSGHKWIGAPWPCGIYLTKVKYQLSPPDDPQYIGAPDTTFAGSRNGFSALILWDYFSKNSFDDLEDKTVRLIRLADYAEAELNKLSEQVGDIWLERSPHSLTIRFKQANSDIIFKYSLSGEELYVGGQKRFYNHIFIMDWVTTELIDSLVSDLSQPGAFPKQQITAEMGASELIPVNAQRGVYIPTSGRGFH